MKISQALLLFSTLILLTSFSYCEKVENKSESQNSNNSSISKVKLDQNVNGLKTKLVKAELEKTFTPDTVENVDKINLNGQRNEKMLDAHIIGEPKKPSGITEVNIFLKSETFNLGPSRRFPQNLS